MTSAVRESAWAKLNLSLDVLGTRPDGFHDLRMIMQSVDLHDDVTVTLDDTGTCRALKDQLAVLSDGTVVPCCLDHEGDIPLGNLYRQSLEEILNTPRARALYEGFSQGRAAEELCRKCGYARRFIR